MKRGDEMIEANSPFFMYWILRHKRFLSESLVCYEVMIVHREMFQVSNAVKRYRKAYQSPCFFQEGDAFVDLHLHTHPTSDRIEMFMVPLSSVVSGSSFQMPSSGSKQADPNISIIIHDVVVVTHECFPKIVFRLRDRAFFWRGTVGKRLDFPLQSMVSRNHTLQLIWDKIPSFRNWFTIFPGWIAEGTGKTRFWAKVWFSVKCVSKNLEA